MSRFETRLSANAAGLPHESRLTQYFTLAPVENLVECQLALRKVVEFLAKSDIYQLVTAVNPNSNKSVPQVGSPGGIPLRAQDL
jgi:hypothetical protein